MPRTTPQDAPGSPIVPEGGLFHDPDAFPGTEAFNLYDHDGRRIGRWYAVEGVTDTELLEALLDFLARQQPPLRLIPPSRPRAS